jgi:hypothetical protein
MGNVVTTGRVLNWLEHHRALLWVVVILKCSWERHMSCALVACHVANRRNAELPNPKTWSGVVFMQCIPHAAYAM